MLVLASLIDFVRDWYQFKFIPHLTLPAYIFTRGCPRTDKPIDFIPEVEYDVIREEGSHKLDRPLYSIDQIKIGET